MAIRLRLGEHDGQKYKEGTEWFTYDKAALREMPASQLIELESHLGGYSLMQIEDDFFRRGGAVGLLGTLYVARRLAGVVEAWETLLGVRLNEVAVERIEDDGPDPTTGQTGSSAST